MTEYLKPDTPLPTFMPFPKFLMELNINDTAKIVYMLLLDRSRLSQINEGWMDENHRVFVYYTIEHLAKALRRSDMTIKTALYTLEEENLIRRVRQGVGRPNRIYVKILSDRDASVRETERFPPDRQEAFYPADGTLSASKNDRKKNNPTKLKSEHVMYGKYGIYQNVLLTDAELATLKSEFPWDYQKRMDALSEYIASTGKDYKNHLATIRSWAKREKPSKRTYSAEAYHYKPGESL